MAGDAERSLSATADVERIEAPVTWKAYLICAFASFGGIFFGTRRPRAFPARSKKSR